MMRESIRVTLLLVILSTIWLENNNKSIIGNNRYLGNGVAATVLVPAINVTVRNGPLESLPVRVKLARSKHDSERAFTRKRKLPPIVAKGPLPGLPFVKVFNWMPKVRLASSFNGPVLRVPNTIGAIIAQQPHYSQLNAFVNMFGAHSYMLADPSQKLTMFAPTNTAFDRLSPNARRLLLPNDYLNRLFMGFTLAAHLVPTTIPPESIWTNQQYDVPTLAGVSLHITRPSHSNNSNNNTRQGHIRVEDANIIGDPIVTQNGIVYPIDQLADPLADLDLSINDVSEKMVDDLFHFSDSFKQRSNNTS